MIYDIWCDWWYVKDSFILFVAKINFGKKNKQIKQNKTKQKQNGNNNNNSNNNNNNKIPTVMF